MTYKVALVVSEFCAEISGELEAGALKRLTELGVVDVEVYPLIAKLLARKDCYDALLCFGTVIRGETGHYDYVCDQVSQGCQRVMLEFEVPVIFGVLTTENIEQARERVGGKHGHKGIYCADAAVHMIELVAKLRGEVEPVKSALWECGLRGLA
jgi:6,7-dimethyl-8-ribityllumazine synthase